MNIFRVKSDVSGNSRHAVQYSEFIHPDEREFLPVRDRYPHALERAKQFRGREYKGKDLARVFVFAAQECEIAGIVAQAMQSAVEDLARAEDLFLTVINEGSTYHDRVRFAGGPGIEARGWFEYVEKADKIARKRGAPKATNAAKRIAMGKVHAYMLQHLKELGTPSNAAR